MIGPRGREIIKRSEGLRLTAYRCPTGYPTMGYGHTHMVKLGDVITETEADSLLDQDCAEAEASISYLVRVPLTQAMRDALISFVFNLGSNKLRVSTLLRRLNAGEYERVPNEIRRWTWGRVDGKTVELPGLVKRREEEAALFLADGMPGGDDGRAA